jgi:hypothetical protein
MMKRLTQVVGTDVHGLWAEKEGKRRSHAQEKKAERVIPYLR